MDEKYYTTPNGTIVSESTLRSKYGDRFDSFLSDGKITEVSETVYETPNGSLVQESVLKDKYGEKFNTFLSDGKLKKKEQTEPVQEAPLPGLGGVSEEPTPSPSVGQGVLRGVDQTQPRGEAFISQASDLTRRDVREPQQDGVALPTGPTGPTGAIGAMQPQEFEFEGIAVTPTGGAIDLGAQYREEKRIQSERNENIKKYGLDLTKGQLTDVFESPIPEEEDTESYLSKQIGRVTSSANNIVNNPKAFGLPADISQMNPNEREEVVDRYIARNYEMRGNGVNMNESELRKVFNQKFDQALAKKKADRDVMLAKQRTEELDRAGVPKEAQRTITINEIKKSDVASMTDINEVNLYSSNQKLQELAGKIASTKDPVKLDELTNEYNSELNKSNRLREELGDDRKIMVDYLTGQHVDKLSDDDDADITEAVNAQIVEFNQPTYKDQLDDIYIKVGLRDQRHREFGNEATDDVKIATTGMARDFSSDAAINRLRSLGYEEVGGIGEVTFKNVPLREQASSYVINVLGDDKRERAERWLATNKQNLIEKEALKNMVLLNMDPTFEKGVLSGLKRGVEVFTEELLPSYASADKALGFTSERKLADAALPLLQEEGIELTENQKKTLERTFGEQATEATFGMLPFIGKVVAVNYMLGPVRALSGFDDLIRVLKSGDRVSRLTAAFLEASFEEGAMQAAGAPTGMGFGFSTGGKLFKAIGLDKFPLRPTGEWARSNKALDAFWNHAIKGASSAEFASVVEAMIKDYEGGETFKNFAEENYSDLSDVTQRMLVNAISFSALGVKDLGFFYQKGKSGFNISNMEKARDEAQRKGYKEEADMLTKYINEYYAGKKTSWEVQLTPEEKSAIRNRMARAGETGDVEIQEWFSKNPKEGKKVLKKGVVSVGTFDKIKSLFGIRPEIIRDLSESKVEKVGENYEVKLLTDGKEVGSYKTESKEEAEAVSNEINADLKEKESVGETAPTVTEPTGDIVPAKQKGRLTKFSTPKDGIVGEVTYEDGTKKELTQEEYDALEKQEGLFDVETGTKTSKFVKKEQSVNSYDGMFSTDKTQGSELTGAIKDDVQGKSGYFYFQKGIDSEVIMMSPDEYLQKTQEGAGITSEEQDRLITDSSKEAIREASERGDKIDMPYLDYRNDRFTQEGRNRAAVAKEKGESSIPVLVVRDSWNDRENKASELAKEAIEAVGDNKEDVDNYLKNEMKLHRDALRWVRESNEYNLLSKEQETVPAETKEAAPIELKEGEIDITTVFKNPVEKNNEQAVAASNEFKDKAGEYDEGVNDPKFKEENTTVEEISVDDIVPTQERLFEKNLKNPSEGEPLVMKVGDKYYVEDGHHRIGNEINADNQTVSVRVYESDKAKQDAIQEQAAGEVPVQPEAKAGEKVEEGKPEAEPEKPTQEGKEVLSKEDEKSEEKVNKKIEEDSGEKDLVKEVVKSTVTEEEKKKVAEEEGIDESEVESKIEEEVKNQINDKTEKEPKTLLQRIASRIRKAIMSLLIVANAFNISGVKAPTAKSKAYDNIKVENLQSFDKMYMDQEAVNKKNNIDIIRKGQANKKENYIIVDKSTGSAHLFKGENLITSYEVGVGKTPGDIETKLKSIYIDGKTGKQVPISVATKLHSNGIRYIKDGYSSRTNWNEGTRTTGAGIFTINKVGKYKGKDAFYLNTEQGISTEMALHKPSNVHRSVLMSDGNPDNNRITNGCVNFQYADLSDLVKRGLTSGNNVYVLPDNPNNVFKLVDGELRFQSADPKVNRTTASTKPFQAQPITLKAKGVVPQSSKEFLIGISENKADIMSLYPAISNDIYNRIAKVAYGIFGQESSFGTYSGPRGKIGAIKDRIQSELEGVGFEDVTVLGKQIKVSDASVGVTQIRLSSVNQKVKERFEINKTNDLFDMNKSSAATMSVLLDIYTNEIPSNMKEDLEKLLPLAWSNRTEFAKAKKGDDSAFNNRYIQKVSKNADGLDVYMGENPIEKPSKKESPTEGEAPIGLMALPLLFGGARRKRKSLSDPATDKVVTEWMEDVQKIYDAQKTKNKREARDQAAVNLALSGKLDNLAPDQVKAVLEGIQTETDAMGKKWSVSTVSELDGLTIKQQFKQGFEEYVAAMKQKEADKIKKAKDSAQKKIDAAKERTAKVIEKIKDDKEARKLFEAIVNDLAKDSGLSQISRNKASELLKSSRDVNAQNLERLIQKAVRVIQYEYTRNIVKESDKKISDFKKNIEKNEFGTLTQAAKELAQITTQDIPIGLLPRFVDVMDGVSKKSPSAKDLEELAKFMSEFKNELDQQITDIQYFADVLNDFKSQEETEKIDDYLKENGFTEAQIDFFNKNRKAINSAYKSFYTKDGKELTAQEKIQKISEQILDAKKVFREMKKNGEAKVDLKKFKGRVQREVDIAEFFNNIEESDIDYLTRSEANKLPVVFDNLNRGAVTNAEKRIMNRIKGERDLDAFEKEDPKSPIKRAKTKDGMFKSFVSNAAEFSKLERSFDPSVLKSSKELKEDIEKKVLDYADEAIKGLKGKPLYNQISKVIRPLVGANTKIARIHEKANELFKKMDGSPLHNTTLMSVYFRSREFDLNPNNPKIKNPLEYIEKTLKNPNLSEKKRAVLKGIRNEYFRNGKPSTKDMLSFIKKSKGGPLIEFMDEVMAARKEDVRFMSEVDESNPAEFFDGYQPRSTMESGNKSIEDLLSDVSNSVGRPSLRSSAVQSRKSTVNALTFDAMDDFMRTVASIEMQKSVAPALSEVNAFISAAKRSGNEDAVIFAETLRGVLDSYVKNTLARDYKQKGLYGNIWSSMGRKAKKNTLAGIRKATIESLIQLGKIHIDEDANNAFYKNASMDRSVSNQQILTALNSMNVARAGVLSSEMSRKRSFITDAVRRGDAGKVEELIYKASKTIPGRVVSGIDDFAGDFNTALIKFPDLMGTVQVVIGGAAIRFKEITGKELDLDKVVNDPEYRAKYKDELDASIAYGDQLGTRMGGPGAMEQKSLQDIKGGDIRDLNRYVRSFPTNENEQILSALTTLGVPTSNVVMGKRERGAEFENKRKAARGLASSLFGLGAYRSFQMALGTLILGLFGAILNGDDWEEEFDYWDWDVFNAIVLGDIIWTSLVGKLGILESLSMQTFIAYGVRQAYKEAGEEEKGEKIADGMFYSTVDQNDKATKTFKMLGPEGKLLGSILETMYIASDAYEDQNFDLLSDPRFKNNLFTISKGALNIPAAQDIGMGVRKAWYGRDENRKVRESFGKSGDSKIVNEVEKEVLRLYKETRDRSVLPSMIKDKPRKITKKGVSVDFFIHGFSVKELQRLKGDFIRREAEKLINTRDYKNVSDSKKIKLLKSIYGNWRESESINSVSKGKYKSIDDFYKHDDNVLKFERSLR